LCFFLDPLCMYYYCLAIAILYLNNSALPLSPQPPQKENCWPDCGHDQYFITGWTMNCWLLHTCIVFECGSIKPQTHNYSLYRLCGLIGSMLDHRSVPPDFEFWGGHSWFSSLTLLHYLWRSLARFWPTTCTKVAIKHQSYTNLWSSVLQLLTPKNIHIFSMKAASQWTDFEITQTLSFKDLYKSSRNGIQIFKFHDFPRTCANKTNW